MRSVSMVSLVVVLFVAAAPLSVTAQESHYAAPVVMIQTQDVPPLSRTVLGSTLGWAIGVAAGAAAGYLVQPDPGDSYFGAGEWWLGAWIGSSVGSAVGAHLGNGRQGNLPLGILGSLTATPVAMIVAAPVPTIGPLLVPAAQIGVSVVIERRTAAMRRARN